ncbi:hypothetical protein [Frankia sp. Cr1]|uniref:hypothetical protein n=1 Tax=Frankia sp. Cr1 TaxID=3073931 RepID=UPI002AD55F30|nr:hypothetical protein [Frankia sp. Cr1]
MSPDPVRLLVLALSAALAVIVGLVAGGLTVLTGAGVPAAVLGGGAAAGGTLALCIAVAAFLRGA